MPDNRSVVLGSTAVIVVAALLRLWPANCPLQAKPAPQIHFDDAQWGAATNVRLIRQADGELMQATAAAGFHRVIKSVTVTSAGRYRLSVETAYAGTSGFAIEVVNGEKYAYLAANTKSGRILLRKGDIVAAGVDAVRGGPGHYRWWFDMDYVPGRADYNFAISVDDDRDFVGDNNCKVVMNDPTFERVPQ